MNNAPATKGTVEVMRDMAERMRDSATNLDRLADKMEEGNDWDAPAQALNTVASLIPNLNLDLLAARPIREHQYRISDLEVQTTGSNSD